MTHCYHDAKKFDTARSNAQDEANKTGLKQMSGYDTYSGWSFMEFCEIGKYELTEIEIHEPEFRTEPKTFGDFFGDRNAIEVEFTEIHNPENQE